MYKVKKKGAQNKKIKKKKIKLRKTPNPLSSIKATSIKRSLFLFYQKRAFTTYNYKKEKKSYPVQSKFAKKPHYKNSAQNNSIKNKSSI